MKDRIKQKGIETIILSFVFIVFARSISYSKEYLEVLGESFWGYLMSSSMYIILIGIVLISKKGRLTFAINSSWVVYLFFVSFFSLQSLFVTDAIIVPFHTFLIQSFVFLMALEMSFRHKLLRVTNISRVFFLLVLYEIIICFLQYGYFIDSQGVYFRVYGTMSNPNLSGMFLAISSPMILYGALLERKPFKYAFLIVFFGVIVAILLLKSRTALIGFVVANTYFLFYFMQSFKRRVEIFFSKTKSYFSYIITFTLLIVGLFFLFNLYSYKKESSESRLMIWKLSTELGFEKPLLGHGLFMFEKEYNLMQARYFLTDSATENEKYNSDFIQIAYNDYLQMFVEGGVIGLGLFISLFISLLWSNSNFPKFANEIRLANSGILCFYSMGMFNSALMAIPVFVVFILFASLRVAISSVTFGERIWMLPKYLSLVFLFIGCFFLYFSFRDSKANRKLSIAYSTIKGGETEKALTDLKTYRNALRNNHRFWILIGDVFQSTGKPKQAIQSYNNALKFTSNPKVFRRVSSSYRALRNYESAINSSLIASNILPYRVWTKFDLMNLYALNREFGKSRSIGNAILKQKPKGKKDIKEIKRQVRFFLQDLDKKIINNED